MRVSEVRAERLRQYALTAGTLGSTAAQTLMVALFPVLLRPFAESTVWIGLVVGGEGLFALLVPYWVGALSDAVPESWEQRWGRRTIFLVATAPLMAGALIAAPFVRGYWPLAALAFAFFAAFHAYLTPLWALMVDAVPPERLGRVHGVRGAVHSAGLAFGLVAGGLLYALWPPLPFLLGGVLVLASTAVTAYAAGSAGHAARGGGVYTPSHDTVPLDPSRYDPDDNVGAPMRARSVWNVLSANVPLRWFLIANALWTAATDGIRSYIFLFAKSALGITTALTSVALALLVVGVGVGSIALGRLGDRFGRVPLLTAGAILTTVVLFLGVFMRNYPTALLLLTVSGLAGSALLALPYPVFVTLLGDEDIGRFTGLYVLSLGIARILAPVLIGLAIDLGRPYFPATSGYVMMWPMAGLLALASVWALRRAVGHHPHAFRPKRVSV